MVFLLKHVRWSMYTQTHCRRQQKCFSQTNTPTNLEALPDAQKDKKHIIQIQLVSKWFANNL